MNHLAPDLVPQPALRPEPRWRRSKRGRELIVGTKFDQPLFGLKGPTGDLEGFDVEIAKIIARAIFGNASPRTGRFEEATPRVREENIRDRRGRHGLAYLHDQRRAQGASSPSPVPTTSRRPRHHGERRQQLDHRRESLAQRGKVCSVTGSTLARRTSGSKSPPADSGHLRQSFVVCRRLADRPVRRRHHRQRDLARAHRREQGPQARGQPFTEEPYGLGIKKGDAAFRAFINDTLTAAAEDGRYAQAWSSTAGTVQAKVPELPPLGPCT